MLQLLSYFIDEFVPMYGGKKGFESTVSSSIEKGDTANTSYWQFPNHLGTHIDFPYHFFEEGQTIEDFPLDFWVINGKKVQVLEVQLDNDELLIAPSNIMTKDYNENSEFLMLKTNFYRFRNHDKYWKYNPGISIELVYWMRKKFTNLRLLGVDSISVSSYQHRQVGRKVHKELLDPSNPILPIEDMNLSEVNGYSCFRWLCISPLMVKRMDGCPCTIFADVI